MVDDENVSWFALRVKPNCEKLVLLRLQGKGYEAFLPVFRVRRRRSDRYKDVAMPLFPGYLFCRFNPTYRLPILTVPGLMHIVGIGGSPAAVPVEEIESLKTAVGSQLRLQPWPFLKEGDAVQIHDGPLRGARGIVVDSSESEKLVVTISLLQRSVAVEIERGWLAPNFCELTSGRSASAYSSSAN